MLPKLSIEQSISILRHRFPGALVCARCARLIATTPAGYARSNLTDAQVETYVCAGCRSDAQVAAETSARFRALAPRVVLRPPFVVVAPAGDPEQRRDEPETAYRRRVERWRQDNAASHELLGIVPAPSYFDTCLVSGKHADPAVRAECPAAARESTKTPTGVLLPAHDSLRAGTPHQISAESGTRSRLAGRAIRAPRRRAVSAASMAALARLNDARRAASKTAA